MTIKELVGLVCETVGYTGDIQWDTTKPDGTPRKLMDVSKMTDLGWSATTALRDGLAVAYQNFLEHLAAGDARL